jgi:hypothetical protein
MLSQINKGKAEVDAKSKAEFKKNWQMIRPEEVGGGCLVP